MEKDKRHILTTRPLPKALLEEAAQKGIVIEELSFIQTRPVADAAIAARIKELSALDLTAVFTSGNAVEAVAAHVDAAPGWKIYCIGNTTRELVESLLPSAQLAGTAENAARLGERLIDDGVESVTFFCGNIRRDELPNKMRSEGRGVEEIVVYNTEETPSPISRDYDAILFFSPSAVHSFFKVNRMDPKTQPFAIGKTTAEAIRQYRKGKILVSAAADKLELARMAMDFFINQ